MCIIECCEYMTNVEKNDIKTVTLSEDVTANAG